MPHCGIRATLSPGGAAAAVPSRDGSKTEGSTVIPMATAVTERRVLSRVASLRTSKSLGIHRSPTFLSSSRERVLATRPSAPVISDCMRASYWVSKYARTYLMPGPGAGGVEPGGRGELEGKGRPPPDPLLAGEIDVEPVEVGHLEIKGRHLDAGD